MCKLWKSQSFKMNPEWLSGTKFQTKSSNHLVIRGYTHTECSGENVILTKLWDFHSCLFLCMIPESINRSINRLWSAPNHQNSTSFKQSELTKFVSLICTSRSEWEPGRELLPSKTNFLLVLLEHIFVLYRRLHFPGVQTVSWHKASFLFERKSFSVNLLINVKLKTIKLLEDMSKTKWQ